MKDEIYKKSDIDIIDDEMLKEANDNGFETTLEYIKWKLDDYVKNIPLHYVDIIYDENHNN